MHAENLVIDKRGDGQAVKAIYELFPYADGITALAFVVEAINAIDFATFMVASQEEEVLFVLDLVCEEQDDALKRILASVHIVAQEKIIGRRREPTILK